MNICKAVGLKINNLLTEKQPTLYKLEQNSGILHGIMMCVINAKGIKISPLKPLFKFHKALI